MRSPSIRGAALAAFALIPLVAGAAPMTPHPGGSGHHSDGGWGVRPPGPGGWDFGHHGHNGWDFGHHGHGFGRWGQVLLVPDTSAPQQPAAKIIVVEAPPSPWTFRIVPAVPSASTVADYAPACGIHELQYDSAGRYVGERRPPGC